MNSKNHKNLLSDLEQRIEETKKKLDNSSYTPIAEQIVGFYSDIEKIKKSFGNENSDKKVDLLENKISLLFESALSYLGGFYSCYQVLKNSYCEYKNPEGINSEQAILYLIVEYSLLKELNPEKKDFCEKKIFNLKDILLESILKTAADNKSRAVPYLRKIESVLYLLESKLEEQSNNEIYKKAYSSATTFIRDDLINNIKQGLNNES